MSVGRLARWALGVGVALVALLGAALLIVPWLVDTPRIQAYIAGAAAQALGRPVKFSGVSLRVLPLPAVVLHDLEVAEDPRFGAAPFLRLKSGRIRLRLRPLLAGRVELGAIVLDQPVVTIVQAADGRLNVSTLGAASPSRAAGRAGEAGRSGAGAAGVGLAISRVSIEGGALTWIARGAGQAESRYRVEDLDLTVTGGGGHFALHGSGRVQPGALAVTVSDGVVTLSGARPLTEAALRGRVALDARELKDLATVVAGPSPALGGGLTGTLTLGGTLGAPTAVGEVQLAPLTVTQTNPQCPAPTRRTLTLPTVKLALGWQEPQLTARPVEGRLGDGTVRAQATVTLGRGVRVQLADLTIKTLPLETVLVDYLCQGYAISGPLDLTGALAFDVRDPLGTLTGPGALKVGHGKVVGVEALSLIGSVVRVGGAVSSALAGDVSPQTFDSPLEFDAITGTYQLAAGVATTKDLLYTSRAMTVAIAGDYGLATGRLNLDMTVTHRRGEIKARVTGTTSSPSVRVSPASIIHAVDPNKAEKGLQDLLKRFGK